MKTWRGQACGRLVPSMRKQTDHTCQIHLNCNQIGGTGAQIWCSSFTCIPITRFSMDVSAPCDDGLWFRRLEIIISAAGNFDNDVPCHRHALFFFESSTGIDFCWGIRTVYFDFATLPKRSPEVSRTAGTGTVTSRRFPNAISSDQSTFYLHISCRFTPDTVLEEWSRCVIGGQPQARSPHPSQKQRTSRFPAKAISF